VAGRRETLRTSLLQNIREAALAELRRTSPSELSLREVARVAGISPSGLYRYFDGRDGLLELLIADGFERFGNEVAEAIGAAAPNLHDRALALAVTYRRWAKANPEQFALILGSPVVGFTASPTGPTDSAVRKFGMPMIRMMIDAYKSGELQVDETTEPIDLSFFDPILHQVPSDLIDVTLRSWARIHGLVILEAFGHLAWSGRDVEHLLGDEVTNIVESFSPKTITQPAVGK
jgi:AcrR family transcriptional regulator